MSEDRFQHEFIMWFGQTWPQFNHLLFEVNNNPKNEAHGAHRKAMGMKKNVSDLILMQPEFGHLIGIECKAPGSVWPKLHIQNQLEWGKFVIKNNGWYIMTSDLSTLKSFIVDIIKGDYLSALDIQFEQIRFVENQFLNKTVKF